MAPRTEALAVTEMHIHHIVVEGEPRYNLIGPIQDFVPVCARVYQQFP
jgi:hypothetical protein